MALSAHANFQWNDAEREGDTPVRRRRREQPAERSLSLACPSRGCAPSPEPATYFMLIDGLNGGSTDPSHKGWFEISSFDFDLANPTNFGSGSGGVGTGKPNFSLLNVALPQEAGLADVMALAATGGLVKGVRIEGFTGGTTPAKVYELSLADVASDQGRRRRRRRLQPVPRLRQDRAGHEGSIRHAKQHQPVLLQRRHQQRQRRPPVLACLEPRQFRRTRDAGQVFPCARWPEG